MPICEVLDTVWMKAAVYRQYHKDATTGYISTIDLRYLFFKGTNLLGATQGTKAGWEEVIGWVSKGNIKPVIDTILPFSNMVEGHIKMADSQLFGKIVTTPQIL